MLKNFDSLKTYLKKEEIVTDGPIFKLNAFTAVLLFAASIIVTSKQWVGKPMECFGDGVPADRIKPVNTYCWINSTFTISEAYEKRIGIEVPHAGIANGDLENSTKKFYPYYQWVCFVLFLQGVACFFIKWLWKQWEGNLMSMLVKGFNHYTATEIERTTKKEILTNYIIENFKLNETYAFRYWTCELLSVVNVFVQIYGMDRFFGGDFLNYVYWIFQGGSRRTNRLNYVFPLVTKCTFNKYGPSGSIQSLDWLCVLTLNAINEKIYLITWCWFMALAGIFSLLILYRVWMVCSPFLRMKLLQTNRKIASRQDTKIVVHSLSINQWWFLYMLRENLNPVFFDELIAKLAKEFYKKNYSNYEKCTKKYRKKIVTISSSVTSSCLSSTSTASTLKKC